jgi:hypothetical protein
VYWDLAMQPLCEARMKPPGWIDREEYGSFVSTYRVRGTVCISTNVPAAFVRHVRTMSVFGSHPSFLPRSIR